MSGQPSNPISNFPDDLKTALLEARTMVVLTGAGISAESGIPTFREAQSGLWARYDPQDLATPQAFERDPDLVWRWYAWRRDRIKEAEPNAGHDSLVHLEQKYREFTLITQNVDGLHERAGSQKIIELHGNIFRLRCNRCGHQAKPAQAAAVTAPSCDHCKGRLRPDVVWFGEQLRNSDLEAAAAAARDCDCFLTIGTSGLVHPAASLPLIASRSGALVVEINPQDTPVSSVANHKLRGPSGVILPAIVELLWPSERSQP